jgi:hypothetical protein
MQRFELEPFVRREDLEEYLNTFYTCRDCAITATYNGKPPTMIFSWEVARPVDLLPTIEFFRRSPLMRCLGTGLRCPRRLS